MKIQVFWDVKQHHSVALPDVPKEYSAFKTLGSSHKIKHHHIPRLASSAADSLVTANCAQ
jgi:hypothetical protein